MPTPLSPNAMLATSMHAQPGIYALLLGSGVSTGAGMPTGWGVVTDLVRKVAAQVDGDSVDTVSNDPEGWWRQHYGEALGYSTLLEALAPTAASRQGLLAGYFEPTEEEREDGIKAPSAAHRAIAKLMKQGYVKVIITTNFDRLMERALEAEGVAPQVIARPDAVAGMEPLPHADATVIKIHGDYKDLGSLNTPEELAAYPDRWNDLLRRILYEYGLVISGWSAEWDTALVTLMENSASRRYPLYWDSRSSKGGAAKRLIASRRGAVIPADGADEMFTQVLANVESLERLAEPPLTAAMAVARLKRYLPDPIRRIELHDLVMSRVDRVATSIEAQPLIAPRDADAQWWDDLYCGHLEASQPLLHLLATGVWHDEKLAHAQLWKDALQRLVDAGTSPLSQATTGLEKLRLYPALLATTTMGLVAISRDREKLIIDLAEKTRGRPGLGLADPEPTATLLHPDSVISGANALPRWQGQRWRAPASHLLRYDLRRTFANLIPSKDNYRDLFSAYEYRLALLHAKLGTYVMHAEWMGKRSFSQPDSPSAQELEFTRSGDSHGWKHWSWADCFGSQSALEEAMSRVEEARVNSRIH